MRARAALLLAVLAAVSPAAADDVAVLEEVRVTATRIPTDALDLPFATSRVDGEDVQRARQQLGLDEALSGVPGVFFQNRYNFAQDLRIAIRGFGARANFGIRGIRIFADDIPQTLPDGQGSVDAIDLGSVEAVEIIRGPFSAVYGSSSGGVIALRTEDGPEHPAAAARYAAGADGFRQWQAKAGGQWGGWNALANLGDTRYDGYREHSVFRSTLFNGKFRYDFSPEAQLTLVLNAVDSPRADDPGALTAAEVARDPRQAAPRNLQFDAGESLDQQSLGATLRLAHGQGEWLLRGYAVQRDFENRLPFGVNSNGQGGSVELARDFYGGGVQYARPAQWLGLEHRWVAGLDHDAQRDRRRRYANDFGVRGPLTTDQDEDVTNTALFLQDQVDLSARWRLTLGGRYDDIRYEVGNRLGNDSSGERDFSEFSPMAGLSWSVSDALRVYGNLSTSFDPPATTELANPFGPTGFNPELDPQHATNAELGLKGLVAGRWRFDLAVFHVRVDDEIVPFELEGSGQSFFRNAGRSTHQGVEASLAFELSRDLVASAAWTWSDFRFDRYRGPGGEVYDGNRIPGIPEHLLQAALDWSHPSGFFAGWETLFVGAFYADDANRVRTGDYVVSDLRAGYAWQSGGWRLEPFVGVNNVFDEGYMANIRLNAAFGRYYEPAPGRNLYAGLLLSFGFTED